MIGHALPVYQGYSSQYGHGLGNVLGGVVRAAVPFVSRLAKKAGTQLLSSGIDYLKGKVQKRKASSTSNVPRKKRKPSKKVASRPPKINKKRPPGRGRVSRAKQPRRKGDIFN